MVSAVLSLLLSEGSFDAVCAILTASRMDAVKKSNIMTARDAKSTILLIFLLRIIVARPLPGIGGVCIISSPLLLYKYTLIFKLFIK